MRRILAGMEWAEFRTLVQLLKNDTSPIAKLARATLVNPTSENLASLAALVELKLGERK